MIKIIAIAAGMVILLSACQASAPIVTGPTRPARINHLAFFQLKNRGDAAELIADCDAQLSKIHGVCSYYAGKHLDTGRGVRVDGDYDVGFYVGFNSEEQYAAYVDHPSHVAIVEKWRPRWEWIRVHDVIDESP